MLDPLPGIKLFHPSNENEPLLSGASLIVVTFLGPVLFFTSTWRKSWQELFYPEMSKLCNPRNFFNIWFNISQTAFRVMVLPHFCVWGNACSFPWCSPQSKFWFLQPMLLLCVSTWGWLRRAFPDLLWVDSPSLNVCMQVEICTSLDIGYI